MYHNGLALAGLSTSPHLSLSFFYLATSFMEATRRTKRDAPNLLMKINSTQHLAGFINNGGLEAEIDLFRPTSCGWKWFGVQTKKK
jgi:hypothetical protein